MTKTSWFKKIWNGRSKGVSSVIGTVFLMLIIFMVSTNVLLWTFSKNAQYNEAVKASNQEEADRLNENIIASRGNYSVSGNEVTVRAKLTNVGSVAAQIINLWVFDTDPTNQGYNYTSLNLNLNPGDVLNLVGLSEVTVTVLGADPGHNFVSYFVTARGNTVPLEKEKGVILAEISQGIGSIAMDFESFRYFEYNSTSDFVLKDYPSGSGSYNVPAQTNLAFGVKLTNFDSYERTLTLNSHSLIWMYFPTIGKQVYWHIVNVNPNGTIETTYTDMSIGYGTTEFIVFASKSPGTFSGQNDQNKPGSVGPAAMNLLLLGLLESQSYGQNIPFVSVYCS